MLGRERTGHGRGLAIACLLGLLALAAGAQDHECHVFGYVSDGAAGSDSVVSELCWQLRLKTLPQEPAPERESPSRDGWGIAYFFSPPYSGIDRPILIKSGAPACEDDLRWLAAQQEVSAFGLGGRSAVLGHVRKSSYGPDNGALPDPHPFADSLLGRWWIFQHNGHMKPDTLLPWIPEAFLEQHPLDYAPIHVDSEVLFRYCQYEIERLGSVREGLRYAFHRVKGYDDFVFNICLTDGDTLWTAHTLSYTPFYYGPVADSLGWWASTAPPDGNASEMDTHHLYWFAPGGFGAASYE